MLQIPGSIGQTGNATSRRRFLSIGSLALGGLSLPHILQAEEQAGVKNNGKGVIMVFLPGGPSHLDMFDLKPDAPEEIRGEFRPIQTNVPGIRISELMPRMAAMMDKFIPVRSLVGAINDHNVHQCVTGWDSHAEQTGSKEIPGYPSGGWPSLGAVISKELGPLSSGIPSTVDFSPDYYDARFVNSTRLGTGGFLGNGHAGFEVSSIHHDNFELSGTGLDRLGDRKQLLASFDRFRRITDNAGATQRIDRYNQQAFEVLASQKLAHALDLQQESAASRKAYGLDESLPPMRGGGKMLDQFLLARRAIQAGARCATIVFSRYPFGRMLKGDYNWDWHKDNFSEARATLPLLDIGLSALIADLERHQLLDDISVVMWGEFGRTPRINSNAGRDHWPQVCGALLAGGGMKTGQVLGETNKFGEHAKQRPVHFREVFATLYQNMGIHLGGKTFDDLAGRPQSLLGGYRPISEICG